MAVMDHCPRSASVRAVEDCVAINISAANLYQVYAQDLKQFALMQMNMGREVCRRLRKPDNMLFGTKLGDAPRGHRTRFSGRLIQSRWSTRRTGDKSIGSISGLRRQPCAESVGAAIFAPDRECMGEPTAVRQKPSSEICTIIWEALRTRGFRFDPIMQTDVGVDARDALASTSVSGS